MRRARHLAGLLVSLLPIAAQGGFGDPPFRLIGQAEGLPSGQVFALEQGPSGFIYIATEYGLARFDGRDMRILRARAGNDLPQHNFQALLADRDGRLWASAGGSGLIRLDSQLRITGRWHRDSPRKALPGNDVWAIDQLCDGRLVLGLFGHAPVVFPPGGDRIAHLPSGAFRGRGLDVIVDVQVDDECRVWVATLGGLRVFEPADGTAGWRSIPAALAAESVFSLHQDPRGRIWAAARTGVHRFDAPDKTVAVGLPVGKAGRGRVVHVGDKGVVWIGTGRGLVRVDAGGTSHVVFQAGDGSRLPAPVTEAILADREGGLWFATRGRGVAYLPPGWEAFRPMTPTGGGPRLASVTPVPSGGMIAAGRDGRLLRMGGGRDGAGQGGTVRLRGPDGRTITPVALRPRPGGRYLSSDGAAVYRHDANGRGALMVRLGDPRLQGATGRFVSLAPAADGRVWVGTLGMGLLRLDPASGELERFYSRAGDPLRLPARHTMSLAPAGDGTLWIGTEAGVYVHDEGAGIRRVEDVSGRVIHAVLPGESELWLADDRGFHGYHRAGDRWRSLRSFTAGRALPDTDILAAARDRAGRFWLATGAGLVRLDPETGLTRVYSERDGLPSRRFLDRALWVRPDGTVRAGTEAGVFRFDPAAMPVNGTPPPVRLTRLSTPAGTRIPAPGEAVRLAWDDMPLTVDFAALSFTAPERIPYRLTLEGWDPEWIDIRGRRRHVYSRLDPGRYTLRLNAANPDGVWHPAGVAVDVVVTPPWWWSRWAGLGYGVLGAGLVGLGIRARAIQRRRRMELEVARRANAAKSDFLAVMGHEIRTPLHGVFGMLHLVERDGLAPAARARLATVDRAGRQLERILDDLLDLSRIEAGHPDLKPEWFDLRGVIDQAVELHADRAAAAGLDLDVRVSPRLPRAAWGDPVRISQILGNLLSNAIRYTGSGRVRIEVWRMDGGGVCLAVADTGPGMSPDQRARVFRPFSRIEATTGRRSAGSGLGLAICRELARAMGGDIRVDACRGGGCRFTVDLADLRLAGDEAVSPLAGYAVAAAGADTVRSLRWLLGAWSVAVTSAGIGGDRSPDLLLVERSHLDGQDAFIASHPGRVIVLCRPGETPPDGLCGVTRPLTEGRLMPAVIERLLGKGEPSVARSDW